MIIEDKRKNCHYEFNQQTGCIAKSSKYRAFLGKRISPNGNRSLVTIVAFENLQSIGVMSMRDAFKRQLAFPELLGIHNYLEVRTSQNAKPSAFFIMDYIDGIPLDRFILGETRNDSPASKAMFDALYSEFCNNRENFSARIAKELSKAIDVLNNNGFSVANIDSSSIFITSQGSVKLMDYGVPTSQINISSEIIVLGRMLHLLLTGTEYNGTVRNVKSKKLKSIIVKAIGKKYSDTDAFRKSFIKKHNWWKYVLSFIVGLIIVSGFSILIKNCMGDNKDDNSYYIQNDVSTGSAKDPVVDKTIDYNEETDFQKGLKDLEKGQQKKQKSKKTIDKKPEIKSETGSKKKNKNNDSEEETIKNEVII